MDLASEVAKLPGPSQEEVVGALGHEREDEQQVGDGQVDDEHVGRRPQGGRVAKDPQHHHVPTDGQYTFCLVPKHG